MNKSTPNSAIDSSGDARSRQAPQASTALTAIELEQRIEKLEHATNVSPNAAQHTPFRLTDFLTLIGSWPAFAFVALALFYRPISSALDAVASKVAGASELSVGGLSLKATIQRYALAEGLEAVGLELPRLSQEALQLMLGMQHGHSLVGYPQPADRLFLPSMDERRTISELCDLGLVEIEGYSAGAEHMLSPDQLVHLESVVQTRLPQDVQLASAQPASEVRLNRPLTDKEIPRITMRLTKLGEQAQSIIVRSVAVSLSGSPDLTRSAD